MLRNGSLSSDITTGSSTQLTINDCHPERSEGNDCHPERSEGNDCHPEHSEGNDCHPERSEGSN
jgi:putative component of membrane protein insertase Oxa1/YidC/SpoIIIJ protein YidD